MFFNMKKINLKYAENHLLLNFHRDNIDRVGEPTSNMTRC